MSLIWGGGKVNTDPSLPTWLEYYAHRTDSVTGKGNAVLAVWTQSQSLGQPITESIRKQMAVLYGSVVILTHICHRPISPRAYISPHLQCLTGLLFQIQEDLLLRFTITFLGLLSQNNSGVRQNSLLDVLCMGVWASTQRQGFLIHGLLHPVTLVLHQVCLLIPEKMM